MSQMTPKKIFHNTNFSSLIYDTLPVTPFNYKFLFETFENYFGMFFKLINRIWEINLENAGY